MLKGIFQRIGPASGRNIDFTEGSVLGKIIVFSLPVILGELLQNFYHSMDAFVLGNFTGSKALAAITVCGFIANMFIAFFNGLSVGVNAVISRRFGRRDEAGLLSAVQAAFSFSVMLGVLSSCAGIFASPFLLQMTKVHPDYYDMSLAYLRIYLAGTMCTVIYNVGAGVLRAVGDSRTPFYILVFSGVLNIVLDLLFVPVMRWGVEGAALATLISQGASAALIYRFISARTGERCIRFSGIFTYGRDTIRMILDIGIAAGLQNSMTTISNIFVVRYMNMFDSLSVAGIGTAQGLDKFINISNKPLGITMTTFVSQNIGAGRFERMKAGRKSCFAVALTVTAVLSALLYIFAAECVSMFNSDPHVVTAGANMIAVVAPAYLILAVRDVLLGMMNGYGRGKIPMMLCFIGMLGFRQVFLAFTMHMNPVIENIYYCYPVSWGVTIVMLLCYYFAVRSKLPGMGK